MASRHFSVKNGKAGKGGSHANYIGGEGKYAERGDVIFLEDKNMPKWAKDGKDFFTAADQLERKNGRAYTEIEFAIPREIKHPVEFAQEFARKTLGENHPFRLAVHDKEAKDGGRNIHAHLMFTERKLDGHERSREQFFKRANNQIPEKGGTAKDRKWNDRAQVQELRLNYSAYAQDHGVALDLRSNKEQGLGTPEPKIGPAHPRAELNPVRELKVESVTALRESRIETNRSIAAALEERKQNEQRINAAAFERIGKNLGAADTARRPAESAISATDRNSFSNRGVIESSRGHLIASAGLAREPERNSQGIAEAIRGRIAERNHEVIARTVNKHLARTDDLLQQIGDNLAAVSRPITRATEQIALASSIKTREAGAVKAPQAGLEKRLEDLKAMLENRDKPITFEERVKAIQEPKREPVKPEQKEQVAERPAKPNFANSISGIEANYKWEQAEKARAKAEAEAKATAPAAPGLMDETKSQTRLNSHEQGLVQRAEKALQSRDSSELHKIETDLASHKKALEARRESLSFDEPVERNALARTVKERAVEAICKDYGAQKPFGYIEGRPSRPDTNLWEVERVKAANEVNKHRETSRPLMFGREDWDKKDADLVKNYKSWDEAVKRLPGEIKEREQCIAKADAAHLAKRAKDADTSAPERGDLADRAQEIEKALQRVLEARRIELEHERAIEKQKNKELGKENDHGMGL